MLLQIVRINRDPLLRVGRILRSNSLNVFPNYDRRVEIGIVTLSIRLRVLVCRVLYLLRDLVPRLS